MKIFFGRIRSGRKYTLLILLCAFSFPIDARDVENRPIREYTLAISQGLVDNTGEKTMGMTVNGSILGPVLEFTEGDQAVILVTNRMDVESYIHWYGLLLPNFQDGVPMAAGMLFPFFEILLSPMFAALAMSFSSVSVIANALRLRTVNIN